MKLKLFIIWFLNLFDTIATLYYTHKYGTDVELNPLMRKAISYSPIMFAAIKILIVSLTCVVCYLVKDYKTIEIATWLLLIVYGYVVLHTLRQTMRCI